jgi:DNA-binding CsgD family transcriptional regulator/tetratricopeptide (TPR) repeat protein
VAIRVTSSRLVGRADELCELRRLLDMAADGQPALVFVAGESGVGKSRLLAELEAGAGQVLHGDCVELGEGELPYAPVVGALRPLAREHDPVLASLPARDELATLLPELGAPGAPGDQGRLFEALLGLLERLGRRAPVLLALEDIHWADRSTSAFLAFLARALDDERVLVVATYRTDEMHRRHPLRPLLAELERGQRTHRIALEPLTRDELAVALEDISGEQPDAGLVDRLYVRSGGNPLFAEELLAAGEDGRGALPPTLRDALMLRVERLSGDAQQMLRVLAVAGLADDPLLAGAGGLDAPALRDALREAVAAHIVVIDPGDRYEFRHALLREVVHDDLLPGERAELHLALARALEQRARTGAWISAAIAHHYHQAGDQPAALAAAVAAAREAERVRAPGEAAALLDRALELWTRVPDAAEHAGADHVEVLVRAANARFMHGDDARSLPLLERAVAELDQDGDPHRAAAVIGNLARAQWALGRGEDSRATLSRALDLLAGEEMSTTCATLLAEQVRSLMLQGRYRETVEAADKALRAAAAVGDEAARGTLLNRRGFALIMLGDHEAGVPSMREAIDVAKRVGSNDELATAYVNLADALHHVGRSREGLETSLEGLREIEGGTRSERWLETQVAEIEIDLGLWASAADRLAPAPNRFRAGHGIVNEQLRRAELALGRGEHDVARELLVDCTERIVMSLEPPFIASVGALTSVLERRAGDLDAARAAVEHALDRIEFCSEDLACLAGVATAGVAVEADAAERACDLRDAEAEQAARAAARLMLERVRATVEGERPVEAARLLTAEAHATRAEHRPDPAAWAAAAAAWDALERPYDAAEARWYEAEAQVAAGDREAAQQAARAALEVADRVGAAWLSGEVRGLAARARLNLGTTDGRAEAASQDEPFGLTARERQVLELLAGGATNRQIGETLFMAEKTASVHVSRILSKLDVRSRTEAAAVAHRQGLAD